MFVDLDCEAPTSPPPNPEALSYALCALISLSPKHEQAALEMSTRERLQAMSAQLMRNPPRGKELLEEAIGRKARPRVREDL